MNLKELIYSSFVILLFVTFVVPLFMLIVKFWMIFGDFIGVLR